MTTNDGAEGGRDRVTARLQDGIGLRERTAARAFAVEEPPPSDLHDLLSEIVEAAIAVAGADCGYIQLLDSASNELEIVAYRGFERPFLDRVARQPIELTADGIALGWNERIVVEDVGAAPLTDGAPDLLALRAAGVRAFQSIPLRSKSGRFMGALSVHHRRPRRLPEGQRRLLDLVARQCADAIDRLRRIDERARPDDRAQWAERLRESEERFRTTVENIPLNLVLYDRELRVLYVNPTLAALCWAQRKVSAADLIGRRADQIWPEQVWTPLSLHTQRAIETGERQSYELAFALPGQPRVVRQWTVIPLSGPEGEVRQILVMSHDVTAQLRLVDELREADRRKSEFIAILSHELRNPLAAIRSSLYVLERGAPGGEAAKKVKGVIDRQVTQLVRMVDDLLDVTRITQNKIQLQRRRLDLRDLVQQTIEDNRSTLERNGVRVEIDLPSLPVFVDADSTRIAQVITNLLWNAVKFTALGGTATVSLHADLVDKRAILRVSDTGCGMEPSMLEHLFVPFMQADRTLDRTSGGLGLGLALVKGLVDLHEGDVSAGSDGLGKGSHFTVRLPLAEAPSTITSLPSREQVLRAQRRVLLIEDDADVADGLQAALIILEHQVEVARNGAEGLERARIFRPDVVLCDIGLPGMSGYDVARAFRADDTLRPTFLVALTGYAQAEDLARARAAGFDLHLAKPPSTEKIADIVAQSPTRTNDARPR